MTGTHLTNAEAVALVLACGADWLDTTIDANGRLHASFDGYMGGTTELCDYRTVPRRPMSADDAQWLTQCTPAVDPAVIEATGVLRDPAAGEAFEVGDSVPDAWAQYCTDVLPPAHWQPGKTVQVGEPNDHRGAGNRPRFDTYSRGVDGVWRYCGPRMRGDYPAIANPANPTKESNHVEAQ